MEVVNTVIAVIAAIGSLIIMVSTVVWAVGQIQGTTQTLALKIEYLGDAIKKMNLDFEDHEKRLRDIERTKHL